jgi:allantoate deiminase
MASGARAVARCDAIGAAPYSDTEYGLFRPYLGPAHRATIAKIDEWMQAAGMRTWIDPAANLVGRYEGAAPDARALLIGSHIDSVNDAGRYDGPLGVMLGIEVVAALAERQRRLPFAIEVIAFGDEEGSRFPASMMCSRAVAGTLDISATMISDGDGISLEQSLAAFGLERSRMTDAARSPESIIGYVEAHIEQGPVLESEGLAVGVVRGIAAQKRFAVTVTGQAGHAGTSAMHLRRDALAAAAEAILAVERVAQEGPADLVATVGRLAVSPGATNVVPGKVDFTIDVRAGRDEMRDAAAGQIIAAISAVADKRGVSLNIEESQRLAASPCDPVLMDRLAEAISSVGQPVRKLVSGAGHDAMVMASLAPTAMLFLRCTGGISHNPGESVDPADAELALAAMSAFVEGLAA